MKDAATILLQSRYEELLSFIESKGGWEEATAFVLARSLKVVFKYILLPLGAMVVYLSVIAIQGGKVMGKKVVETGEELLAKRKAGASLSVEAYKKLRAYLGMDRKEYIQEQVDNYITSITDTTPPEGEEEEKEWDAVDDHLDYDALKYHALAYLDEHPEDTDMVEQLTLSFDPSKDRDHYKSLPDNEAQVMKEMFELTTEFDFNDLQHAYNKAVKLYHPDYFQKLNEYYEMLQLRFYYPLSRFLTYGSPAYEEYRALLSRVTHNREIRNT